jgi:nucleoside-diphosphate-sugar epimerase
MTKKKIIIFGASGLIGKNLFKRLLSMGHNVIGVDVINPKMSETNSENFIIDDLRLPHVVSRIITKDVDEIYQLADNMGYNLWGTDHTLMIHNATLINLNILDESVRKKVKKIFLASDTKVYNEINGSSEKKLITLEGSEFFSDMSSSNKLGKLFIEKLYQTYQKHKDLDIRIGRIHNVIGIDRSVHDNGNNMVKTICTDVVRTSENGEITVYGNPNQSYSFLHVEDCIDYMIGLMDSNYSEPVNIGSDELITLDVLVKMILNVSDKILKINFSNNLVTNDNVWKSDNTLIRKITTHKPKFKLRQSIEDVYSSINLMINGTTRETPISVLGEFDEELQTHLPAGVDKNWRTKYGYIPTAGPEYTTVIQPHVTPLNNVIRYRSIENIRENSPYLCIIHVLAPNFFMWTEKDGFKSLNEKIIKDTINGKCKIILVHDAEGMSGMIKVPMDFEIIERWCNEVGINPKDVHYIHGNKIGGEVIQKLGLTFNYHYVSIFEGSGNLCHLMYDYEDILKYKPIDEKNLYINLNRRPRFNRILLLHGLKKLNLFDRGSNSYNFFNEPYETWVRNERTNLRKILKNDTKVNDVLSYAKEIHDNGSLIVDEPTESDRIDGVFPISHIEKSFFYLVTETLVEPDTLFITEKTFKPLAMGVPFVVFGNINTLQSLKEMGYKTFSDWWDESYDEVIDVETRMSMILKIIDEFSKKPLYELIRIREEMTEVLRHNKKVFNQRLYDNHYMIKHIEPKYNREDPIIRSSVTYEVINEIWKNLKNE